MNPAARLTAAAAIGLGALASATAQPAQQPNIIFILTDDLGYGDVGVFYQNQRRADDNPGRPWHRTPNIDRMAAEGARFTSQYVAAPVCVASRASLMQGVHQGHATVRNNQFDKALEENHTLGTVLRQAGYATAAIGKWGLQGTGNGPDWTSHPLNRGFDYYYGYIRHIDGHEHYPVETIYFKKKARQRGPLIVWENRNDVTAGLDKCYTTDLFTARAKKWIVEQKQNTPNKPFFLYLAYDTPHAVLELPAQAYPAGGGLHGGMQWLGTPGRAITTASGTPDSWIHPEYKDKPWTEVYKRHATSVRRIDDAVGDLLQLLKDLNIDDNTLVVFTSDNGPAAESYLPEDYKPSFFGTYGPHDGIKRDCLEGGLRVPTITRWPAKIPANRVIAAPTAFWDWMPTFAAASGLTPPARTDGVSLLPLLSGKGAPPSRAFYFEYFNKSKTPGYPDFEPARRGRLRGEMQAIRIGDMMGVRYDIKSHADDFEIYNVVTDPKETQNLAAGQPALQAEMKARVLQMRVASAPAPRPYDDEFAPAIDAPAPLADGLAWKFYPGQFPWVPALDSMAPADSGTLPRPDTKPAKQHVAGAISFTGYLQIPADGEYTFHLLARNGATLRIHDATVVDADYGYQGDAEKTGAMKLKAGLHPFRLVCRSAKDRTAPRLDVSWSAPGLPKQPIPAGAFKSDK
ncbi:arylsulfatase A-like enzyme [Ereboglobus sp. PH5-5]|uniref:sulfatase-like hydrolase/transferase n=1 Tax=Ereboglobus sp. PH5-5 TaxID=2940529 RepID=UPI00240724E2|nr:sulfatase-like hydrolase/transferase [Ereboglobus sp. PH5-5]MDF9832674.1 arylsulfatase A-like enzyme [Ereboglobus sp. PH5-5]